MNEKAKNLYEGITNIDDNLIEAAYAYKEPVCHKKTVRRILAAAACLCICAVASLPVMAASGSSIAYDTLYAISPAIAQKLVPVNERCESKGIVMEVESAYIEGSEAEILVSFKDVEKDRIDGTLDLFDSYTINTPHDSTNGCAFQGYDDKTGKVTFLISIENDKGKNIEGDKITFSVSNLLINKKEITKELTMIDMKAMEKVTDTYNPEKYGAACSPDWEEWDWQEQSVLVPNENNSVELCEGVTFTGAGIVDGEFHIQIKYEDVLNTDNHGFISLKDSDGNIVECKRSVSFRDKQDIDGYEEYLFDIPAEQLSDYVVIGEFVTSGGLVEGDWEITFPVYPSVNNPDGTASQINAIRGSDEFNALSEYIQYLQSLNGNYECDEDALYDDPEKVRELSEKYGLKYAKSRNDINDVKELNSVPIINDKLEKYLNNSGEFSGYTFDDGNVHFEFIVSDTDMTDMIVGVDITPEGSFPWPGYSPEIGIEKNKDSSVTTDTGNSFIYTGKEQVNCFGKIDAFYVTVSFTKTTTDKADQIYNSAREKIYIEIDSEVKKETKFNSYRELQIYWANGGKVTEKELAVYEYCHEQLWQLQLEENDLLKLEKTEIEKWLNKIGM